VGDSVGFQVRFQSKPPKPLGSILYCTSGILLRTLRSNPQLDGVSHVILDEAHERDVNTDILLLLLKRVISKNQSIKVIIMSATINPQLFLDYFPGAEAIHIPGFTYPVQSHFLDELREGELLI